MTELSAVMRQEVFMAGLGGQGALTAGQLLAQAAMSAGLGVTWYPSNSAEMRGGSATCTVVMSEGRVGSPVSGSPGGMLLMAPVAVQEHIARCAAGGVVIVNTSLGDVCAGQDGIRVVSIAATDIARTAGGELAANMVMLGAYLQVSHPELMELTVQALREVIPKRRHSLLPANEKALRAGADAVAG